jgi:hypothetical protein
MTTPNLLLSELSASQAQPHLTVNSALRRIDAAVQLSVTSITNTPPGSPTDGDRYIVGTVPSGVWVGHEDEIAVYVGTAWAFLAPAIGWLAYVRAAAEFYVYGTGSPIGWEVFTPGGTGSSDPLTLADRAQPASPSAASALIYSHDVGNVGVPMLLMPLADPLPLTLFGGLLKKWSLIGDGSQADLLHYSNPTFSGSTSGVSVSMTGSNLLQFHPHQSTATSASTNQVAGVRWTGSNSLGFYRNYTTNANVGGGYFHFRFAYENALSTGKLAVGLVSTTATVGMGSGVQPSAQVNCIMLGADEGDTNLQFMHNDGTGTCTKVDLGVAKTALSSSLLDLYILLDRNGNAKISLHNLENGNKYSADITTDLPADNTLMYPKMFTGNGATATAVTMRMYGFTALDQIGAL